MNREKGKLEAFIQQILQECEKEGLSIQEVRKLPQALKFAISDSVSEQVNHITFKYQNPVLQESCSNDDCSH